MSRFLFVCTGNICRSVMAEHLAGSLFILGDPQPELSSAGVLRHERAATSKTIAEMSARGLDVKAHRSKHFSTRLSPRPDLIVTMAREHSRAIVEHDPSLFDITFTLKEFVRLAERLGPKAPDESMSNYFEKVGRNREMRELAGMDSVDDVADPIGRSAAIYRACAVEIEGLLTSMNGALFPSQPQSTRTA